MGSQAEASEDTYGSGPIIRPINVPHDAKESSFPVVISHVETPSLFYVYLQIPKYDLDKELNIFMSQYKSMFTFQKSPPSPQSTCVCCYSVDLRWYRAIVLNWSSNDVSSLVLKVYFCDYGNTEDVAWKDNLIYRMPRYFASKSPMQAIPCAMFGKLPTLRSGWSEDEINRFYQNVSDYTDSFQKTARCKFHLALRLDNLVFVDFTEDKTISAKSLTSGIGREWDRRSSDVYLTAMKAVMPDYLSSVKPIRFPFKEPVICARSTPSRRAEDVRSRRETAAEESGGKERPRPRMDKKTANEVILRHLGMVATASSSKRSAPQQKSRKPAEKVERTDSQPPKQPREEAPTNEEHDRSGACSPITTMACQPPQHPTDFPDGSLRVTSRWSNLPDLVVPCGPDGRFRVILCHVDNPNKFYVNLCTKETGSMMTWLEQALNHHYDWYSERMFQKFFDGFELSVGDIVCAEAEDFFARAVIVNIRREGPSKEQFVRVFYIDFGYHEDNLPLSKIHILSPEYFYQIPAQAIECSLYGVEPIQKPWTSMDKNIFANVCGERDKHGSVEELSIFVASNTDKHIVAAGPLEVYLSHINAEETINLIICSGENPIAQIVEETLEGGSEEGATTEDAVEIGDVTNDGEEGEDPPDEQKGWNVTDVIYRQSLNERADRSRIGRGETYRICDFYKARGKCMWGNKCRMLHTRDEIDGGRINLEFERNISKNESVSFLDTGAMMHYPKKGAWIGITVTAVYQPNRFYVQFLHGPADYLRRPECTPEEWDFSASKTYSTLTELINEMNFIYNEMDPPDLIDKIYALGELVAVRASDDSWYRGTVVDHDSDGDDVIVKLLDTGDVESVRQAWVHPLHNRFLTGLPIQAFECFLTHVQRPTTGWSKDAWRKIVNLTDGQPLQSHVDDVLPSGILNLTVWDTYKKRSSEYTCINQCLIQEGHAIRKVVDVTDHELDCKSGPWRCPDEPNLVFYPG